MRATKSLDHFLERAIPCPISGCWFWLGGVDAKGYAKTGVTSEERVHRLAYKLAYGKIEPEKHILHKCDVPSCINPLHLYAGDNKQNIEDKCSRNRSGKKLSKELVVEIRALYENGVTQGAIAKKFSINQSNVSRCVNAKRWRHVHSGIGG